MNETIVGLDADVQRTLELVGLFVYAVSGALLAVRKHFDVVGMAVLAFATACGGGITRDVILGDNPPIAFRDLAYLFIPLAATAAVFIGHSAISTHLLGIGVGRRSACS
ncbi:MAG TPA: TRIC cation channel family protein [Ilumatobacter sp.]|nr:TRIC cation channel family protein [Ilumatobacter sp.]